MTFSQFFKTPDRKSVRAIHALVLVVLFIGGVEFSAVKGYEARKLDLPFAWVTSCVMFLAPVCYFTVGILLQRTFLKRVRWLFAYGAAILIFCFSGWLNTAFSKSISLNRWLKPQEMSSLESIFHHPYVHGSSSGKGFYLIVKRSDYDDSLVKFLTSIDALKSPQKTNSD